MLTLERIIAIVVPHKAAIICTKKNSAILLLVILISICLMFISSLFVTVYAVEIFFDKRETLFAVKYVCLILHSSEVYYWLSLLTRSILPFSLMFLGNIIILFIFHRSLKMSQQMRADSDNTDNSQLVFLTKILITSCVTYLILTLPIVTYTLTSAHIKHLYSSRDQNKGDTELWLAISSCLIMLNHSINFFLYCIAGKKFRDEFKVMVICKSLP